MNIRIEFIPHEAQRYSTVGDWRYVPILKCPKCLLEIRVDGELPPPLDCPLCKNNLIGVPFEQMLLISVSKLSDAKRETLIALHELVEVKLCETDGITQQEVDDFDINFEEGREKRIAEAGRATTEPGTTTGEEALIAIEEPGDQPDAPYREQHCFATGIERLLAARLGVCWKEYEAELEALP
jgi:hypothetical protein